MIALKGISRIESKLEKFKNRVRADGGTLLNYDTIQSLYSGLPALARTDASMVMLPCGYKSGKVYGLNGNDFTFSRASNATRINSSGLIELVSSNLPRFKYNPSTLAYEGLLIEKASTNLHPYSESFNNASGWNLENVTVTPDAIIAPDGTLSADKFIETTANATHDVFTTNILTITNGATYTWSIFAKAGERTWVALNAKTGTNAICYFDLANGVVGDVDASCTATITPFGNGWYRLTVTRTSISTSAYIIPLLASANGVISYTGVSSKGAFFWGAQIEAGSIATSYIPTTTASTTRAADSLSIANAYTEGTVYVDYNSFGTVTTNRIFSLNDGTANNSIHADLTNFSVLNGGVSQAAIGTTGVSGKIAAVYKVNDFAIVKNGGAASTDTSGTIPTVNTLKVGSASSAGSELNGTIKALAYFPTRRTNTELQTLTS